MAFDAEDRTEQPTERRRREARQQGRIARSADLAAAIVMLAGAGVLFFYGLAIPISLGKLLQSRLSEQAWTRLELNDVTHQFAVLTQYMAADLLPLFAVMLTAAIAAQVVQVGFLFNPELAQPNIGRLSPLHGVQRVFSLRNGVQTGSNLLKLAVVILIAGWWSMSQLPQILNLSGAEPSAILTSIHSSAAELAFVLAGSLIAMAGLDYLFQRWRHEQELKMTQQEVRDELKLMEADPAIRRRRRESHQKLVQARDLSAVRTADVVIAGPSGVAVAVKYDPGTMQAPTIVAKGKQVIATRICQLARDHEIVLVEREQLAGALFDAVEVGQSVPPESHDAFIEIMGYVSRLTGRSFDG